LRDREPDAVKVRDGLIWRIGEITTGHLCPTLKQMPYDYSTSEQIPIIISPAELVHQRSQEQRRVADSACQHDICALGQRIRDRPGRDVRVRGHKIVTKLLNWNPIVRGQKIEFLHPR